MLNLVTLNDKINGYGDYYCKEINAKIEVRTGSVKVTYLTNAMSKLTCRENTIYSYFHDNVMDLLGIYTVKGLEAAAYGDVEEAEYVVYHRHVAGYNVFNPFADVKKQNLSKLTVGKFVKAVLAGQVKSVVCAGKYTDDYVGDAVRNYDKGVKVNVVEFAQKIIESGSRNWNIYLKDGKASIVRGHWAYYEAEFIA